MPTVDDPGALCFLVNVAFYERDPDNCPVSDPSRARTPNPTITNNPHRHGFTAPSNTPGASLKPQISANPTHPITPLDIPTSFILGGS